MEINELQKTKKAKSKSEQRGKKKSKCIIKNIHTPAMLKKEKTGTKAKFTFSTHTIMQEEKSLHFPLCCERMQKNI